MVTVLSHVVFSFLCVTKTTERGACPVGVSGGCVSVARAPLYPGRKAAPRGSRRKARFKLHRISAVTKSISASYSTTGFVLAVVSFSRNVDLPFNLQECDGDFLSSPFMWFETRVRYIHELV